MPTSVLLAVLAAAGLLALAPALVRRYDATERQVAERAQSTARVLSRQRRRRSVPGRRPVNPSRMLVVTLRSAAPSVAAVSAPPAGLGPRARPRPRPRPRSSRRPDARAARPTTVIHRRRRILAALLLFNAVELAGVIAVGPGYWISFAVSATLLVAYLVHLRNRALALRRASWARARQAAWLAARQAEVRREQALRAAARQERQRRIASQRDAVRRAALGLDRRTPVADPFTDFPPPPIKEESG